MKKSLFYLSVLFCSTYLTSQNKIASNVEKVVKANSTYNTESCIYNFEPNDSFTEAYYIVKDRDYNAGIDNPTDVDYYNFELIEELSDVKINLQNLTKDYVVKLYNMYGDLILNIENSGINEKSASISELPKGDYYIQISGNGHYDLNNCYKLSFNAIPTTIACNPPTSLNYLNVSQNESSLIWRARETNQIFTIETKSLTDSIWITAGNTTSNAYKLSNLKLNTTYQWRIKATCDSIDSNYTQGMNFTTLEPVADCVKNYEPNNSFAEAYLIDKDKDYTAGIESSSDQDYYKFNLDTASKAIITLKNLPKNYDLLLLDSKSRFKGISTNGGTSDEIIKVDLDKGTYYIIVNGKGNYNLQNCYTLKVTTEPIPCYAPIGIGINKITTNTVTLNWIATPRIEDYTIEYKATADSTWTAINNIKSNSYILTDLKPNTTYNLKMKINCSSDVSSEYSPEQSFTTKLESVENITLYPNPVRNTLYILGINYYPNQYIMTTIFDRFGRVVKYTYVKAEDIIKIDVSSLAPETYYLKILNQNLTFIKQ